MILAPLKARLRGERGQVLPFVAIALAALIGIAGLTIDIGRLWVAQRQLQQAVDASSLVAGQFLPNSAQAYTQAVAYSATNANSHGGLNAAAPTVTFKCLTFLTNNNVPCAKDTSPTANTNCHPAGSQAPSPAGSTTCNAVSVSESAFVPTTLLGRFLPSGFTTVTASSTSAMRGGVPHPLDVMIVLDATGSMSTHKCGSAVMAEDGVTQAIAPANTYDIDCAKDGVRRLLKTFLPCAQTVVGNCNNNTPVDEVGLTVFPGLLHPSNYSHDPSVTYNNLALEGLCPGQYTTPPAWYMYSPSPPTTAQPFPTWFLEAPDVGYTNAQGYLISGLTNNFKLSDTSALNPASVIVAENTWDTCTNNGAGNYPGNQYYGFNTGGNTYYAAAINAAQAVLAGDSARHAQPVIILLSDGDANTKPAGAVSPCRDGIAAAQAAAQAGTWVYTIAYNSNTNATPTSCSQDSPGISAFSAMQQMARSNKTPLVPDPTKFYCDPQPAGQTCNSAATLAQAFSSIGVDLTSSRVLPDGTS